MQEGVESLNPGDLHANFLRKFDWGAKVCLHLHRPSCKEILVHDAVRFCRDDHLLHRLFSETRLELTALSFGDSKEFINDTSDKRADADLLEELGM